MRTEPPAWANEKAEAARKHRIAQRAVLDSLLGLTPPELRSKAKKSRRRVTKRARRAVASRPISRPRMGATKQRKVANRRISRIAR